MVLEFIRIFEIDLNRVLAALLFLAPMNGLADDWVVTRESATSDSAAVCVLQSRNVSGIALRFDGNVEIVSDYFLDERADRASIVVDSGAVFPAQQRFPSSPHALIVSGAYPPFDTEFLTPQLVDEFMRGRRAQVTVETIFDGSRLATIPLTGFTRAYGRFLACRNHFAEKQRP